MPMTPGSSRTQASMQRQRRRSRRPRARNRRARPPPARAPRSGARRRPRSAPQTMTDAEPGGEFGDARLRQRLAARAHQQARAACRAAPRRARAPARRPSSPCRARRRPACRRRCGACRSAWSRMSMASSDQRSDASALPARLDASGPGNISGKIVSDARAPHRLSLPSRFDVRLGGTTTIRFAVRSIVRHRGFRERQHQRRAAALRRDLDRSPAPKLCTASPCRARRRPPSPPPARSGRRGRTCRAPRSPAAASRGT